MRDAVARAHRKSARAILCWIGVLLCVTGVCRAADPESQEALLTAYVDIWNTGELERLDGLVSSDFQRHAGPDESCRSRGDLKKLINQTRATWNHLRITIDDQVTTDDDGAYRGEFYGVHAQVGGVIQFAIMSMVRFEDGLIAEEWIIGNNFLSLMVLGYELVPPGFEIIPASASPEDSPPHLAEDESGQ
jgi:hypothetical protein